MRYRSATIAPGVKRPPPMGSLLVNGEEALGVRGPDRGGLEGPLGRRSERRGVGVRGISRAGTELPGASVSPSTDGSGASPRNVSSETGSCPVPHRLQNRAEFERLEPQLEQYIGAGVYHHSLDCISLCPRSFAGPSSARAGNPSAHAFHLHGGAIGQHFGGAGHDFVCVITHADHGVGSVLRCMLQQYLVGLLTGLLA